MSQHLIPLSRLIAHIERSMRTPTVGEIIDDVIRSGVEPDPERVAFHNARFAARAAAKTTEGTTNG